MKWRPVFGRIELPHQIRRKRAADMYHTTGFRKADIQELCALVRDGCPELPASVVPPILGLYKCVLVTLAYLRRNRVQAELAEMFDVSQPTISRAVAGMTPLLGKVLDGYVPTADDLNPRTQYLLDGTLLPCWSWACEPKLFSGKHKTTGMNVQVACDLSGRLAWISDPVKGHRHDYATLDIHHTLDTLDPQNWVADKGYQGSGMITPFKKPPQGKLLPWQKDFNKAVNSVRATIERVIAHFKTWRIMHTDYRRPLKTFTETISTVIALHFYKLTGE
jgi:hypothetical protein